MLINQLKNLSDEGVFYCIWKNIHNYFDDNSEPYDLDIYIYPKHSQKAFKLLKKNGWIRVFNPVAEYKSIRHYFLFKLERTYHLHIYIGLRTGDSWLKNYYFPIDKFIMNNTYKDNNDIMILSQSSYYIIYMMRMIIKNSTLIGRYLYRNSKEKYIQENLYLNDELVDIYDLKSLDFELRNFIHLIYKKEIHFKEIPNLMEAKNIAKIFEKFSLINTRTILIRQIFSLLIRLSNKFIFRLKKIPFKKGNIIVFYGTDGCGKSSLVTASANIFKKVIPTSTAHLGKPFSGLFLFDKILYRNPKYNKSEKLNKIIFFSLIKTTSLSLLRLLSSYIQLLKSKLGIIVISDRWPVEGYSDIDGPKKYSYRKFNLLIEFFNRINLFIYNLIPKADISIYLDVNLEETLFRNANRNQPEPEEFIRKRYKEIRTLNLKSKKKIIYKNYKNLDQATNECLNLISTFIDN